ncbi:hypothetical protein [Mesorhizobium sp. CO1-1-9]|uniref:hypothetical protein n=1 Tax=Mesorhizobium sp. CO1-1-9 TaxID=2876630 RepID=UPI001CC93874|nr:hypothetical protein [Mesorhizobium sp. CO1-1-9]MBZ9694536.1 hypothetical protein [Mesorhizobium sp. CO1-1-9]
MRFMRTWALIVGGLTYSVGAHAAEGDHLRCSVDDFLATKAGAVNYDRSFVEQNKQKSFDIYEFVDKFTVVSKSSSFSDSSTDYRILERSLLQTSAIAIGSDIDAIAIYNTNEERSQNLIHASVITLSPQYSNIWYLLCILGN